MEYNRACKLYHNLKVLKNHPIIWILFLKPHMVLQPLPVVTPMHRVKSTSWAQLSVIQNYK